MTQKRGEVDEKFSANQMMPDIFENWLNKRVEARSRSLGEQEEEDKEEDEIDRTEDLHEKAHRRKRGRGSASSSR